MKKKYWVTIWILINSSHPPRTVDTINHRIYRITFIAICFSVDAKGNWKEKNYFQENSESVCQIGSILVLKCPLQPTDRNETLAFFIDEVSQTFCTILVACDSLSLI